MISKMTKHGYLVKAIAADLVGRNVGDRVPTIAEYASRYSVGIGTVQSALRDLTASGAIELSSHGAQGSVIVSLSVDKLWEAAGRGILLGILPIADDPTKQALASGVYELLSQASIPINISFMRGSENRLQSVAAMKGDFAIMSKLAWERRSGTFSEDLESVAVLGDYTYSSGYCMVHENSYGHSDRQDRPYYIAVDPYCADLAALTYAHFGLEASSTIHHNSSNKITGILKNARFVPCLATEVPWRMSKKEIDGAVMDTALAEQLKGNSDPNIRVEELARDACKLISDACAAVVVTSNYQLELGQLLARLLPSTCFKAQFEKFLHKEYPLVY